MDAQIDAGAPPAPLDQEVQQLIEAVYRAYHYDFRRYAFASLKRRLSAAMSRFHCASMAELQDRVLGDAKLFQALLDYLTVQVSEMFRDPAYFKALRVQVLPRLATYPSLKLWVAGCSTGEEVYSLAILLEEEGLLARTHIYATDINARALAKAEAGVYDIERIAGFTENHQRSGASTSLSSYYTANYGRAVFDRALRRQVVFSDHSLATDSVFSEVQMVSCRNVLIYFQRDLQDRAIGLFREALCPGGFLGIGSRESLRFSAHADGFSELVADQRIYQKAGR
jgi:chemotaxis protein methyltransferase CheR